MNTGVLKIKPFVLSVFYTSYLVFIEGQFLILFNLLPGLSSCQIGTDSQMAFKKAF